MNKIKYVSGLKLLCFFGKCSKYLYYTKKVLCVSFFLIVLCLGLSVFSKGKITSGALKGLF